MSTTMGCLQCGRTPDRKYSDDFCSAKCEAAHREKLLGRLSELSSTEGQSSDSWHAGLQSLAQTTTHLRYSTAEIGAAAPPTPAEPKSMGRLITLLPAQGGSGASTTSLQVADAIARNPAEKVLLIDYDLHSGTTAFRLGLQPQGTLDDLLKRGFVDDNSLKQAVTAWGHLDVLVPAAERGAAKLQFSRLDDVVRVAMEGYSTVVVDHPDALYSASHAVLSRASFVGIICTPDISALYLVRRKRRAIAALLGRDPNRLGLIVNRATSWGSLDRADVERVAEAPILAALPNDYAAVRRASWQGGLIERDSALAVEMLKLAERIDIAAPPSVQAPDVAVGEKVQNG
jgi:Flp pilus assembly CpaE family ATPase